MGADGRGVWQRIFSVPDPDEGLIAVIDSDTGRIVRIPGVYPAKERRMRIPTWLMFVIAMGLFLFVGVANSRILGTVDSPPGRIELNSEAGPCLGNARSAAYVAADGSRIPGCWIHGQGGLFVVFMDGEIARIPIGAVKPPTDL